ncbi:MAG: glycosyltransferase family 39 protein, partial [Alphaproteobacteria bacterium]|nr:glycosyltransferase family 39 protein [Alphaproteobacteria bacterium]
NTLGILALLFCMAAIAVVALHWIRAQPHIAGWDELQYILLGVKDAFVRRTEGWGAYRDTLFNEYRWATPGPRLLALPMSLLHALAPTPMRLLSAGLLLISLGVLFDALRRIAPQGAAAAATAIIAVSPQMTMVAENYMSEALAMPALAVLIWCLVREIAVGPAGLANMVLLGAAIGIGLLARFSFVPVSAGALLFLLWRAAVSDEPQRSLLRIMLALFVATLIAWPFYAYNGVRYASYARFALSFPLDLLPSNGTLDFAWRWSGVLLREVFGVFAAPVVVLGVGAALWSLLPRLVRTWRRPDAATLAFVVALLLTVPTFVSTAIGSNQNPRYLVGVLPPLALLLAAGFVVHRPLAALAGLLAVVQAAVMLAFVWRPAPDWAPPWAPLQALAALSQRPNPRCDFGPVIALARQSGEAAPIVRLIGDSDAFTHIQVEMQAYQQNLPLNALPAVTAPDLAKMIALTPDDDVLLVLEPPDPPRWHHPALPDPNRITPQILAAVTASGAFTEVKLPPTEGICRMRAFVPHAKLDPARRAALLRALH